MISITRLLCDLPSYGDELRYRKGMTAGNRRPIVVFNCTRRCNLACIHCYSNSANRSYDGELTTEEAKSMILDLADFKVPVILFSGGEPFLRPDLFELIDFARHSNIRTVISTNGTMITKDVAGRIKKSSIDYVGVSLDGIGARNDGFRGSSGAFDRALSGIRNLVAVGQKAGLRFTITRHNYADLRDIFKLVEDEAIDRVCFYHLVYSGRGSSMTDDDLPRAQMRECIDAICDWAKAMYARGMKKEVLTVDNHADALYVYLKTKAKDPARAKQILELLTYNKGNASGIAIANVDNVGRVHADQFWQSHSFGNVRERKFGDIWMDISDPVMKILKDRISHIKGRCSRCGFLELCNANFRARAEAVFGDMWQEDPACYLSEEEICSHASGAPKG
ncbi:MAG: radical SAM protein [Candidatus Omnitrophica bacterium]|nr:radical SAM protein [Candidatus Omnitrophota bacterium]